MADTLKFGPQWLRALSDGGSGVQSGVTGVTSPPPSPAPTLSHKYKLAEHRYGREEMLALFVPNTKIPDEVKETPSICVEKSQHPLAFMQPCEEEQRLMSQSVNSSVVLRMMGQGRGGPMSRGGRGGPADRGRGLGRGRGRGEGYYQRGPYDEEGFGRGRPRSEAWDDSRDKRFERGFPGKPMPAGFEEGPTSPRKEFSRSMSSDNWRDMKKEEEDDSGDWRRAGPKDRWGNRSSGWSERPQRYDPDFHGRFNDYSRDRRPPPFDQERSMRSRSRSTGSWEDPDLPEWSTMDVEDGNVGTFDSSGAFMSLKDMEFGELEELEPGKDGEEGESATEAEKSAKENGTVRESEEKVGNKAAGSPGSVAKGTNDVPKTGPPAKEKHSRRENTPEGKAAAADKTVVKSSVKGEGTNKTRREDSANVNSANSEAAVERRRADPNAKTAGSLVSSSPTITSATVNAQLGGHRVQSTQLGGPPPAQNGATGGATNPSVATTNKNSHNSAAIPSGSESLGSRSGLRKCSEEEADFDHLEKAAENLVATMDEEDIKPDPVVKVEQGAVPLDHEDAKKWFYKDPQGDLQGPFSAAEMSEWFSAGYFTMNLLVKRGCDETFQPLGELIKAWGRVPFLPGPALPPLKSSPQASAVVSPVAQSTVPGTTAGSAGIEVHSEHLKALQTQVLMQQQFIQQQQMLRHIQLQQIIQSIQQQPSCAKLSPQEQQNLALQLLIKQQTGIFQQQQQQQQQLQAAGSEGHVALNQPGVAPVSSASPQPQPEQPQQMKLSPRSTQEEVTPSTGGHADHPGFHRSLSQPGHNAAADFHRSMSTPSGEQASLWGAAPGMPAPPPEGGSWAPGGSVWDIEPTKPSEVPHMAEIERMQREQEEREQEERRKEEERRKMKEEERRRREHEEMQRQHQEMERQKEIERQREIERQKEMKKQELERQEMEHQREMDRQRMEQLRREQEEVERRRREEEERRQRQEEEERERRRVEELRRLEEERKRRGAEDQTEKKRQEEIRRRQEKEEIRRLQQQQEAVRRLQQEQMAKMQLPASAQWGSGPVTSTPSGGLSMAQIQQLEAETERKEQIEHQRKLDLQRQQIAAIQQQQQQQQSARWSNQTGGAPSLLDIQQEQARQQHDEVHRQQHQQQQQPQVKPSLPLGSAAVWGNNSSSAAGWATEGAWGSNPQTQNSSALGFWDEAVNVSNKKTSVNNNANFPSLTSSVQPSPTNVSTNRVRATTTTTKAKKEEESVQRLFSAMKPADEFTQWCEKALRGMQTSVDIPTFIAFLLEVESPYEVHDYVRSYLGEGREPIEFARLFLEKRSKHRNNLTHQRQEDSVWEMMSSLDNLSGGQTGDDDFKSVKGKKKNMKKKMQKLDSSILGFTVHAAPDRIVGEIESSDKV